MRDANDGSGTASLTLKDADIAIVGSKAVLLALKVRPVSIRILLLAR